MASPTQHAVAAAALLLAASLAATARAQAPEQALEDPPHEVAQVRVRYGLALREGSQIDPGPDLTYTGMTPNDFAGSARAYFVPALGAAVSAQREGFALFTSDQARSRVSGGSLLRLSGGPAGRLLLGPLTLEAVVGYQLAQVPAFGSSAEPDESFDAITRHAALGAARLAVELPFGGIRLEARGEYPFALAVSAPSGEAASSSGLAAGASLVVPLGVAGTVRYALVGDYQYVQDSVKLGPAEAPTFTASQVLQRAGVAVELSFLDRAPGAPRSGSLLVRAVDADSGRPLPSAAVALEVAGRAFPASPGAPGSFSAQDLPPGTAVAKVTAGGYLAAEGRATVVAGREAVIDVKVKKEPPRVGSILVTLLDKESQSPIAGAVVRVRGVEKQTSPQGTARFDDLAPGPATVEATVADYHPASEVASVVASRTSEMPMALVKAKAALPATITGLIRNSNGGRPIAALLEIPEAKVKTRAAASNGAFTVRTRGGTYTLIISAPGFITQQKTVTVKDGDQAIYNIDLHPSR